MAFIATLAAVALVLPVFVEVWRTTRFFDTDDAMRLVQVRDLLAGQGWFDLVAHRLNPPDAVLSHWSRVIDVPLAGMILFFSLFTSREIAETLTRLTFPLLVQFAYFAALFTLFRRMAGPRALIAGFFLAVLCSSTNLQFLPGRIDHHAPQILLLVLMALMSVRCLAAQSSRAAMLLGCLIALSMAISIENLPFIVAILAVFSFGWIFAHEPTQRALRPLGAALAVASILAFAGTVPPARYLDPVADAFGIGHLAVLVATGLLFVACSVLTPHLRGGNARLALVLAAGLALVAALAAWCPYLLHDPLSGVDPLVRSTWLSRVREARPLWLLVVRAPVENIYHVGPLLLGIAAIAWAIRASSGAARWQWIALAALALAGALAAAWQVRALTSVLPIVLVGGAWAVVQAIRRFETQAMPWAVVKPACVAVLFCVQIWQGVAQSAAQALPVHAEMTPDESAAADTCFDASSYVPLRALPATKVLAPIDLGPFVLVYTPHAVVAAPYHRNNAGNRLFIETMLASPGNARALAEKSRAQVLAFCPFAREITLYYAKLAPDGLAAALLRGQPPAWLSRIDGQASGQASPIQLYVIR
ncbi:hypothetical protein PY365_14790 [Roseiarcaceae bacterium H3SJ34-1]|uniref:hypothetical protein n=1 Tax=Terripilifer ovatus TaxID=3032367 RepID=UPI003AB998CA|nr:hypothetical protein [Roseiarcaceae bacterium H3SJ34-1]